MVMRRPPTSKAVVSGSDSVRATAPSVRSMSGDTMMRQELAVMPWLQVHPD